MSSLLPDINRSFPGLSGSHELGIEIASLESAIRVATDQMQLERKLESSVRTAQYAEILGSRALELIIGEADKGQELGMDEKLNRTFGKRPEHVELSDETAREIVARFRFDHHPDRGGDPDTAIEINGLLEDAHSDPSYAIAKASLLSNISETNEDISELLTDRYKLHFALQLAQPLFGSPEEAETAAAKKIAGIRYELRVAAIMELFKKVSSKIDRLESTLPNLTEDDRKRVAAKIAYSKLININLLLDLIVKPKPRKILTPEVKAEIDQHLLVLHEGVNDPRCDVSGPGQATLLFSKYQEINILGGILNERTLRDRAEATEAVEVQPEARTRFFDRFKRKIIPAS